MALDLSQLDQVAYATFSPAFQHQVQAFGLADKAQPGFRKILVFFLVDPTRRILSTADIPPQQRDWYAGALRRHIPEFYRLPKELLFQITKDYGMNTARARMHREKLMEERKEMVETNTGAIFQREFSLCEH